METRRYTRQKLPGHLALVGKKFNLLDVSSEGCSVFSEHHEFSLNEVYESQLVFGGVNIGVNVIFVNKNEDKKRYGAEFLFVEKGSRNKLQNYLLTNRDRIK